MNISSRTPEGEPFRCDICGDAFRMESSPGIGDATCPRCGQLVGWFRHKYGIPDDEDFAKQMGMDSLDVVEMAMEVEDHFGIEISEDNYEQLRTSRDLIRYASRMLSIPDE